MVEGALIPSENELAAEFGAARMTVRRALAVLEAEGLLRREAGRGTFATRPAGNAQGLVADMQEFIATTRVRLLFNGVATLPAHAATAFGEAEGAPCLAITRLRSDGGGSFSHVSTFIPLSVARALPGSRLARGVPVLKLLAARGLAMHRADQFLSAEAAPAEVADAMGLALGVPLMRLDRTAFNATGQAFEYSRNLYRPDRFAYRVALDASGRAAAPRWHRVV